MTLCDFVSANMSFEFEAVSRALGGALVSSCGLDNNNQTGSDLLLLVPLPLLKAMASHEQHMLSVVSAQAMTSASIYMRVQCASNIDTS